MSGDLLFPLTLGTGLLDVGLFAYAAYWGFRVRAVLIDRLYRTRAQWLAMVSVVFATLVSANLLIGALAAANWYLGLLQFIIEYAGAALTFAWVDTTIQVAKRSDPLQRDTLHWKTLRIFLWGVVIVTIAVGLGSVLVERTDFFSTPGGPKGALLYGPFGNILALIALLLSRRRSKDVILRRHMGWFSLFVLVLVLSTQDLITNLPYARLIVSALLVLNGLLLYMAARSLVPVSGRPGVFASQEFERPAAHSGSSSWKGNQQKRFFPWHQHSVVCSRASRRDAWEAVREQVINQNG